LASNREGDLDDAAPEGSPHRRLVRSPWTWEAGVEKEEEQGKRFAAVARDAGVQHFVYQSVGSAHRQTGIPHFENKFRIEDIVRGLDFPSHVIIRPVFFMENLLTPWFLNGDKLCAALKPTTVLQMIAVSDIGQYGARAFTDAARLNRREIDIAGDAATMPQTAATLGKALRRPIEFVQIPIEEVRKTAWTSRSCSSGSIGWATTPISPR
jgi:uncharacterized protein YbjT (DUF2867 family)